MKIPLKRTAISVCVMLVSVGTVLVAGGGAAVGAPSGQVADVDWAAVQDALGRPGTMMAGDVFRIGMPRRANGSVVQYTVARAETILENGHALLPAMGVATAINFQPSGASTASITGDFVLIAGEVNAVAGLRAALDQTNSAAQQAPVAAGGK